jgi:hypothetical protein
MPSLLIFNAVVAFSSQLSIVLIAYRLTNATFFFPFLLCPAVVLWEAEARNASAIFGVVPPSLLPRYQYFNLPVSATKGDRFHPLRMLKAMAQPEDFVSLKLDIDHNELEAALVEQILSDPQLYTLIDEMFFEHHGKRSTQFLMYKGSDDNENFACGACMANRGRRRLKEHVPRGGGECMTLSPSLLIMIPRSHVRANDEPPLGQRQRPQPLPRGQLQNLPRPQGQGDPHPRVGLACYGLSHCVSAAPPSL